MGQFKFKFSIIMAVYNVEYYLQEAVESVLKQDIGFKENVQLILVDDGSTDKSGIMCDDYARKYSDNIIVIHKENGGSSSARNAGLPYVKGRYINFLDSDDKFTNNVLSEVYKFFIEHEEETDIVAIPMHFFDTQKGEHILNYKFKKGNRIINLYKEYNASLLAVTSSFFAYHCKESMNFDSRLVTAEDAKVILSLLYKKMKIGVVSSCKHMYRRRGSGDSLIQTSTQKREWYLDYLTYFDDWAVNFYKEKLGFVPAYVQYLLMYDLQWKVKDASVMPKVLTVEEIEQYKKKLFDIFKYIDGKYILEQKHIGREHKNFILSKKYDCKPQVTLCDNDALIHFGNSVIGRVSDFNVKMEFMEYKDKVLYLEGFTKILCDDNKEKVDVYILCNGEKISCELVEREKISTICFDELIFRGIGFKCKIPMDDFPEQGEIKSGVTFRGIDIIKKDFMLGKFFPIVKNPKNSYYQADNLIITVKDNVLLWRKCTEKGVKEQENLLLKELWQSGKKAAKKAAVSRYLYNLVKPLCKKEIWLLSDRINKADDNGEALFEYINKNKLPVDTYFVLRKDSADYFNVKKFGKVVNHLSWKHKFLHLLADRIISAATDEDTYNPFRESEKYYHDILVKKQRICLQHGIIKDYISWLNKYSKNLTMLVTSAVPEYKSIMNGKYFYDEKVVKLTGLARYDRLQDKKQKIIAIMPTWRINLVKADNYLRTGMDTYDKEFLKSEYFKFYNNLLNNEELLIAANKYGYRIKFMPHPRVIQAIDKFTRNSVVEFCSINTRYRDIFAESALVVTDYSSVAFDFVYLRKPVIYCQFDKEDFYQKAAYNEGYFDYERDGFGEVEYSLDGTVDKIIEYMENGCTLKDKYRERIDTFFAFHDRDNCKRICEAIKEINLN